MMDRTDQALNIENDIAQGGSDVGQKSCAIENRKIDLSQVRAR